MSEHAYQFVHPIHPNHRLRFKERVDAKVLILEHLEKRLPQCFQELAIWLQASQHAFRWTLQGTLGNVACKESPVGGLGTAVRCAEEKDALCRIIDVKILGLVFRLS